MNYELLQVKNCHSVVLFSHEHSNPNARFVEQEDPTRAVVTPDGTLHSLILRA